MNNYLKISYLSHDYSMLQRDDPFFRIVMRTRKTASDQKININHEELLFCVAQHTNHLKMKLTDLHICLK